jgi:hypothetical protein
MTILKRIKRWFRQKFGPKKKHVFDQEGMKYLPCLPMDSRTSAYYKLKVPGDSEALMRGGFKPRDKKRKKA